LQPKHVGSVKPIVHFSVPLQAWTGPEGCRRWDCHTFWTVRTWR